MANNNNKQNFKMSEAYIFLFFNRYKNPGTHKLIHSCTPSIKVMGSC